MKKINLVMAFLFVGLSLFAVNKNVAIENSAFKNSVYDVKSKTIAFNNKIGWNSQFCLPVSGDLSSYKSLVFDVLKSTVQFRVKFVYVDDAGVSQTKTYYQNPAPNGAKKIIDLKNVENITSCKDIKSITVESAPQSDEAMLVLNSVYLVPVE